MGQCGSVNFFDYLGAMKCV